VEDTLTERVGKRIRSRLYEMCRTVEISAPDYRKEIRNISRFRLDRGPDRDCRWRELTRAEEAEEVE